MNIYGLKTVNGIDINEFKRIINIIDSGDFYEYIIPKLNIRIKNNKIYFNDDDLLNGETLQSEFDKYYSLEKLFIEHDLIGNYELNLNSEIINTLINVESYQINTKLPVNSTSNSLKSLIINTPTIATTINVQSNCEIVSVVNSINKNYDNAYGTYFTVNGTENKYYGIYDTSATSITSKSGDTQLSLINIPKCETIKNSIFSSCTSLTKIMISSLTSFGYNVFYGIDTSKLNLYIRANYENANNTKNLIEFKYPGITFYYYNAEIIPENLIFNNNNWIVIPPISFDDWTIIYDTEITVSAYAYNDDLVKVYAPNCITVNDSAFTHCHNLQQIYFPVCKTVKFHGFRECYNLEFIDFPLCEEIGAAAFNICNLKLKYIEFPLCEEIGLLSFGDCPQLTKATLPSCTIISNTSFNISYGLTELIISSLTSFGDNVFRDINTSNLHIKIQDNQINAENTRNLITANGTRYTDITFYYYNSSTDEYIELS